MFGDSRSAPDKEPMPRMSSMLRISAAAFLATTALSASAPLAAEDASQWDRARAALVATQPGPMADAIARWEQLSGSQRFAFSDYASIILTYPGFPDEERLRGYAE